MHFDEYAGVAGFEKNDESEESNYFLTNQITGFLVAKKIKKLSINPHLEQQQKLPSGEIVEAFIDEEDNNGCTSQKSKIKKLGEAYVMQDLISQCKSAAVKLIIWYYYSENFGPGETCASTWFSPDSRMGIEVSARAICQ